MIFAASLWLFTTIEQSRLLELSQRMTEESVMQKYLLVFQKKLVRLAGRVHLMVDETIMPTNQLVRRVLIAIKKNSCKRATTNGKMDIIAKEEQPTNWISSYNTVKKNGKIRVFIDHKSVN